MDLAYLTVIEFMSAVWLIAEMGITGFTVTLPVFVKNSYYVKKIVEKDG